jgi:hypothetical protein
VPRVQLVFHEGAADKTSDDDKGQDENRDEELSHGRCLLAGSDVEAENVSASTRHWPVVEIDSDK